MDYNEIKKDFEKFTKDHPKDDLDEWLKNKREKQYLNFWEEFKMTKGHITSPHQDYNTIKEFESIEDVLNFKYSVEYRINFINNVMSYLYVDNHQDEDFKLLEVSISKLLDVKLTCNNRIREILHIEDGVTKKKFNSFSNF